jgi:hypothetical protein
MGQVVMDCPVPCINDIIFLQSLEGPYVDNTDSIKSSPWLSDKGGRLTVFLQVRKKKELQEEKKKLPSPPLFSLLVGVFGGITFVLYSIIAMTGIQIWVDDKIDFSGKQKKKRGDIVSIPHCSV